MHIWLVNHYLITPNRPGGTRHYNLAQELKKLGVKVTIIAANFDHFSKEYVTDTPNSVSIEEIDGINIVWLPTPAYKGNSARRLLNMFTFSYQLLKKKNLAGLEPPDIIYASSPHLFASIAAKRLSKRYNIPYVLEVRDLWPESLIQLGRISRKHPLMILMKGIEKHLYKTSDHIISLLPGSIDYIKQHGAAKTPVTWLPNFINLDNIPEVHEPYYPGEFKIIYAGSHGIANNLDLILDAAKLLNTDPIKNPINIEFIGDGPEKERLIKRAHDENINIVKFKPAVNKDEIYDELAKADAFILALNDSPLYQRGMSLNKLFDYMAMKKPVIFAGSCCHNPISTAQAGIVVPADDPQKLAEGITELAALPYSCLQEMGKKGRKHVEENYNLKNICQNLYQILNETLAKKSQKAHTNPAEALNND